MKRYVCRECPSPCVLISDKTTPHRCVLYYCSAGWRPESPAESEAREEQEARAAMAVELRQSDEHF